MVFLLWEIKNHYWKKLLSFWRFIISGQFPFHLETAAAHVSLILWRGWFFLWGQVDEILPFLFVVITSVTFTCYLSCHHREELLHNEGNALLVKSRTNIAVTCNLLFTLQWLCTLHYESVILQYLDVALGLLPFSSKQALLAKVRLINCEVVLCI